MAQANSTCQFNIHTGDELTWNVMPLLHEVKHALGNLINKQESTIIDLRSIPLAPGEEEKILTTLGRGEVQANLDAMGPSEIIETEYAGVWVVTHYNDEHDIISRFIEITNIPEILASQSVDIIEAYKCLTTDLDTTQVENSA
jgi:hydrogenase-1 operon protein HyaF